MNEVMDFLQNRSQKVPGTSPWKQSAHQVSYLAVSGGDSKGVHDVGSSGWRRASAIMDSGSAECVAPEDIARNTPLMETEASSQGQTYHTADGGVIKNKWGKIATMCSERGDQFFARHWITDVTCPLNSVSRVCDQGKQDASALRNHVRLHGKRLFKKGIQMPCSICDNIVAAFGKKKTKNCHRKSSG